MLASNHLANQHAGLQDSLLASKTTRTSGAATLLKKLFLSPTISDSLPCLWALCLCPLVLWTLCLCRLGAACRLRRATGIQMQTWTCLRQSWSPMEREVRPVYRVPLQNVILILTLACLNLMVSTSSSRATLTWIRQAQVQQVGQATRGLPQ